MRVGDSMSRNVFVCHESDPIDQVIERMGDRRVRRVPVLDRNEGLVGILSMNDIARRLGAMSERERARLAPRFVDAVAAICESRECAAAVVTSAPAVAASRPVMVG
jgi:CBS domain-containing protein